MLKKDFIKMAKRNYFSSYLLDISLLEDYVDRYDWIINIAPKALDNEYTERASDPQIDMYSDEMYILGQEYGYTDMLLKTHIRALLYSSLFTTCYSYFENKLIGLCIMYQKNHELDISYNDINGSGDIEKCNLYLKKVLKIKLSSSEANTLWMKINEYRIIRNLVVHNNAKPPKTIKSNEKDVLNKYNDKITITDGELDITDSTYIKDFINIVKEYLGVIMDEYYELYPLQK